MASLDRAIANGGEFVRRHAEAGEPGFVEMWASIGGMARFDAAEVGGDGTEPTSRRRWSDEDRWPAPYLLLGALIARCFRSLIASEDAPASEPGHEPDEEYLAMRERIGWQSVTLVAGLIVVLLIATWLLVALTAGRR